MLSANEIRNVRFTNAVGGYKRDEVDILLDKVEADYEQFERTLNDMKNKITALQGELEDAKNAQGNIQNVLISAQKFADQIVEEAKVKSAEIISNAQASIEKITEQEKELTDAFDKKAGERKDALQNDVEKIIANAEKRQAAVESATQDCVERQQSLFNKMKLEIAAFKAEVTAKYKEHLELLAALPDTVTSEPEAIATAVAKEFDNVPTIQEYIQNPESIGSVVDEEEEIEEPAEKFVEAISGNTGFVINADGFDLEDEQTEEEEDI